MEPIVVGQLKSKGNRIETVKTPDGQSDKNAMNKVDSFPDFEGFDEVVNPFTPPSISHDRKRYVKSISLRRREGPESNIQASRLYDKCGNEGEFKDFSANVSPVTPGYFSPHGQSMQRTQLDEFIFQKKNVDYILNNEILKKIGLFTFGHKLDYLLLFQSKDWNLNRMIIEIEENKRDTEVCLQFQCHSSYTIQMEGLQKCWKCQKEVESVLRLDVCAHDFCIDCLLGELRRVILKEEKSLVLCPHGDCEIMLSGGTISYIINQLQEEEDAKNELFSKLNENLFKSFLNSPYVKKCPRPGCKYHCFLSIDDDFDDGSEIVLFGDSYLDGNRVMRRLKKRNEKEKKKKKNEDDSENEEEGESIDEESDQESENEANDSKLNSSDPDISKIKKGHLPDEQAYECLGVRCKCDLEWCFRCQKRHHHLLPLCSFLDQFEKRFLTEERVKDLRSKYPILSLSGQSLPCPNCRTNLSVLSDDNVVVCSHKTCFHCKERFCLFCTGIFKKERVRVLAERCVTSEISPGSPEEEEAEGGEHLAKESRLLDDLVVVDYKHKCIDDPIERMLVEYLFHRDFIENVPTTRVRERVHSRSAQPHLSPTDRNLSPISSRHIIVLIRETLLDLIILEHMINLQKPTEEYPQLLLGQFFMLPKWFETPTTPLNVGREKIKKFKEMYQTRSQKYDRYQSWRETHRMTLEELSEECDKLGGDSHVIRGLLKRTKVLVRLFCYCYTSQSEDSSFRSISWNRLQGYMTWQVNKLALPSLINPSVAAASQVGKRGGPTMKGRDELLKKKVVKVCPPTPKDSLLSTMKRVKSSIGSQLNRLGLFVDTTLNHRRSIPISSDERTEGTPSSEKFSPPSSIEKLNVSGISSHFQQQQHVSGNNSNDGSEEQTTSSEKLVQEDETSHLPPLGGGYFSGEHGEMDHLEVQGRNFMYHSKSTERVIEQLSFGELEQSLKATGGGFDAYNFEDSMSFDDITKEKSKEEEDDDDDEKKEEGDEGEEEVKVHHETSILAQAKEEHERSLLLEDGDEELKKEKEKREFQEHFNFFNHSRNEEAGMTTTTTTTGSSREGEIKKIDIEVKIVKEKDVFKKKQQQQQEKSEEESGSEEEDVIIGDDDGDEDEEEEEEGEGSSEYEEYEEGSSEYEEEEEEEGEYDDDEEEEEEEGEESTVIIPGEGIENNNNNNNNTFEDDDEGLVDDDLEVLGRGHSDEEGNIEFWELFKKTATIPGGQHVGKRMKKKNKKRKMKCLRRIMRRKRSKKKKRRRKDDIINKEEEMKDIRRRRTSSNRLEVERDSNLLYPVSSLETMSDESQISSSKPATPTPPTTKKKKKTLYCFGDISKDSQDQILTFFTFQVHGIREYNDPKENEPFYRKRFLRTSVNDVQYGVNESRIYFKKSGSPKEIVAKIKWDMKRTCFFVYSTVHDDDNNIDDNKEREQLIAVIRNHGIEKTEKSSPVINFNNEDDDDNNNSNNPMEEERNGIRKISCLLLQNPVKKLKEYRVKEFESKYEMRNTEITRFIKLDEDEENKKKIHEYSSCSSEEEEEEEEEQTTYTTTSSFSDDDEDDVEKVKKVPEDKNKKKKVWVKCVTKVPKHEAITNFKTLEFLSTTKSRAKVQPSNKNIQLVLEDDDDNNNNKEKQKQEEEEEEEDNDDNDDDDIKFQFHKCGREKYSLAFLEPFSPVTAFAMCVAIFEISVFWN